MRAKGYGTYHGRSSFKTVFKVLLVIALLLAALAAAVYFFLLPQFVVVSSDGVRLDLPFFQREEDASPTPETAATPPAVSEQEFVVVAPEPTPEPTPPPAPSTPIFLPQSALYDGTALDQVAAAGGDCAMFDMKADTGLLSYDSGLELALNANVSSDNPAMNAAIRALNGTQGLYAIARVSCFKDHAMPRYDSALAIRTNSGYLWTDPDGVRWMSPTSAEAQAYLVGVCVELAQLGFDEILLVNAGYPDEGHLEYIKKGDAYDQAQFGAVVGGFYAQISQALAPYGTTLSIVTTSQALAGLDELTGQTPEGLALAGRLWLRNEAGALYLYEGA